MTEQISKKELLVEIMNRVRCECAHDIKCYACISTEYLIRDLDSKGWILEDKTE